MSGARIEIAASILNADLGALREAVQAAEAEQEAEVPVQAAAEEPQVKLPEANLHEAPSLPADDGKPRLVRQVADLQIFETAGRHLRSQLQAGDGIRSLRRALIQRQ